MECLPLRAPRVIDARTLIEDAFASNDIRRLCLTSLYVIRRVRNINLVGRTFMNARLFVIVVACIFLTYGCSTPQELAARAAREAAVQRAAEQEIITVHRNRCSNYGFREGTESFARCMQNERMAYNERVRQAHENFQKAAAGMTNAWKTTPETTTTCTKDAFMRTVCTTQ